MIRSASLRWNVDRPIPADCRGAYVAAYRDPDRKIPEAITRCDMGGWMYTLIVYLESRRRSLIFARALPSGIVLADLWGSPP